MPSRDAAGDVAYFTNVLGAHLVFAVEGMGTRVAMVELTEGSPRILLAEYLEGDRPVLVYRVGDLAAALDELEERGWRRGGTFEIPQGPTCSFTAPGGPLLALYALTRPAGIAPCAGRGDFWSRGSRLQTTNDHDRRPDALQPAAL